MLEGISLDQLLTFIAAADEGSFSAAGRRLKRGQSVVSHTVSNLESHLGVRLFDRTSRFPVLTDQGRALLVNARAVTNQMDLLKARAKGMTDGCEPDLTIVVDPIFPIAVLTRAMPALQKRFPETAIKLYVEPWGAVIQHVLDGRCAIGVMGSLVTTPPQVAREGLMEVRLVTVVSPEHPLARHRGTIPTATLAKHIQLMHTDRSNLLPGRDSGLVSPKMWLIAHIEFKREFVLAGFGFALMPLHMIEQELVSGALVQISVEDAPRFFGNPVEMSAIYRVDNPPGPAGRWLIDRLMQENGQRLDKSSGLSSAAGKPKSVRSRIRGSGHTR